MMLSLWIQKTVVIVFMFVSTVFFGFIPYKLVSLGDFITNFVSLCSSFSGGVFLGACLLDIFPDVQEAVDVVLKKLNNEETEFPLAQFIIVTGFFIVLILEQIALRYKENHFQDDYILFQSQEEEEVQVESNEVHQEESRQRINTNLNSQYSVLRSLMLLFALSFHSFFEGLAIGLQTKTQSLINLVVAVVFHKGVMAFSLGLNLARVKLTLKHFLTSILIFSAASPVGIGVGMGLMDIPESATRDIINTFLQGVAGGTFLFITFIEVLPHEFSTSKSGGPDRLLRVLALILGFTVISILILFAP